LQELDSIRTSIAGMESVTAYLQVSGSQIYHTRNRSKKVLFKNSLLEVKANLLSMKSKLTALPSSISAAPLEHISNLVFEVDSLHENLSEFSPDSLEERVDLVQRVFATIRGTLPLTLLELEMNVPSILRSLPPAIKVEVKKDLGEISRCYAAQAFRASIVFCGRVTETILLRRYFEKRTEQGLQPHEIEGEYDRWTLGVLIRRCRELGILEDIPGLDEYSSLVNAVRIPSVHSTRRSFNPGPDAAKGVISLTLELVKSVY
jgi:hypothetical protein